MFSYYYTWELSYEKTVSTQFTHTQMFCEEKLTGIKVGEKEGINQSRFSQSGFPDDHQSELETLLHRFSMNLKNEFKNN